MANVPFLDLISPHAELKDELLQVVARALDGAQFIGGPMVADFEAQFARYVGVSRAVGVGSGTDALRLALLAMGLKPGDPVVTVPNTFIATTEAISQAGGRILFVDIEPQTCLMDPQRLSDLLKKKFASGPAAQRPVAVVPVHLYGQCADMDAILELAGRYELKVLEDAAQAHGASYKGQPAGSMGQAAAFSFYPGKNLGACGEAGAVTTNDQELAQTVAMLRDHGQSVKYHHALEGYNARLDAIQAGFLLAKLPRLEGWNSLRRQAAARYDQDLARLDWVRPVQVPAHNISAYHLYVIHVARREALAEHLRAQGVQCALHYPVPLHLQECYRHLGWGAGSFLAAEASARELLSLPIYPGLGAEQQRYVVEVIAGFQG